MNCKHCNNRILNIKPGKLYCSVKCRKDYNRTKTYTYVNTCPVCNKQDTRVTTLHTKSKSKLGNSTCRSCINRQRTYKLRLDYNSYNFWTDESRYFRNCPICNCILEYKKRYYAKLACDNNAKCLSCSSYGIENGKIVETLRKYNVNSIDEYEVLLPKKTLYYKRVWQITNKQPLTKLNNYTLRRGGGYALDHIYPIAEGFRNNIPADLIGSIDNLQMLPKRINEIKSDRIIQIPKLIQNYLDNI